MSKMSRKRRGDAIFDDEDKYYSKRGRPERDTVDSLIFRIGSKDMDKIHKDINDLCGLFCYDLEKNFDRRVRILQTCAKNIPERMEIYSTLMGLINVRNHKFISKTVEAIIRDLKDSLKAGKYDDVRFIVRFLSSAVNSNVIHPGSLLSLYESFAEVTVEDRSSSQARTDWYCYVVLSSLPYSAKRLNAYNSSTLDSILSTIGVYLKKRQTLHVPMLRVWDGEINDPQEDYLQCLWAQITAMQSANWKENVLWRISDAFTNLRESGQPCEFGQVTPPDYEPEKVFPLPQVIFRLFDYADVFSAEDEDSSSPPPALPGAHTIERFLVDEEIHIILETMHFNRVMCARALLGLKTRVKLALEYMVVEAILADIFHLPKPPVRHGNLLFYASLLIQLCSEAVNSVPLVLAQAVDALFDRLDSMKPVCIARFVEWFSYHLTNYELKWNWADWARALEEPLMSPRRWFLTETFRRLIRYSYYENVKRAIPRSFYCLLPPNPSPLNPFEKASVGRRRAFTRIHQAFVQRQNPEALLELVKRLASQSDEDGDNDDENMSNGSPSGSDSDSGRPKRSHVKALRRLGRDSDATEGDGDVVMESKNESAGGCVVPGVTNSQLELFMATLLHAGWKTISHTCSLLNRYSETFRTLASTVELQVEALHILQMFWRDQPQMVVAISDYMTREGLLDPESIVGWAFSPYMSAFSGPLAPPPSVPIRPRMLQSHVWECLMHTLVRVGQRIAQITPKLEAAKFRMSGRSGHKSDDSSSDSELVDDVGDLRRKLDRRHRRRHRHSHDHHHHGRRSRSGSPGGSDSDFGGGGTDERLARLEEERGEAMRSQCAVITLLMHRHARLLAAVEARRRRRDRLQGRRLDDVREEGDESMELALDVEDVGGEEEVSVVDGADTAEGLKNPVDLDSVAFWLKGRLMQTVLEHQDQLLPYMDNLEELMSDLTPYVRDVFQALRSLYA